MRLIELTEVVKVSIKDKTPLYNRIMVNFNKVTSFWPDPETKGITQIETKRSIFNVRESYETICELLRVSGQTLPKGKNIRLF